MRNCPHCGEPIQDEATLCKHCHQEVEPPLWVNSMRRCQHCAEWIDLESEDCPQCGQHVGAVDLTEPSAFIESLLNDDFLDELPPSSEPAKQSPFIEDDSFEFDFDSTDSEPAQPEAEGESEQQLSARAFWGESRSQDTPDEPAFAPGSFSADPEDEADPEPSFRDREVPDFSRDLRRALVEPEPGQGLDSEPEPAPEAEAGREPEPEATTGWGDELEPREDRAFSWELDPEPEAGRGSQLDRDTGQDADLDREPTFSPERPFDRELAYGSGLNYADEPDQEYEPDAAYEPESLYESQAEQRARHYGEQPAESEPAASAESDYELHSSVWASEVKPMADLRSQTPEPRQVRSRVPAGLLQGLLGLILIGGLGYGLVALVRGPAGAVLAEALATDVPSDTPIPQPTATRSVAPTLPPETQAAIGPTAGPDGTVECLHWDQVGLEHGGSELCVYGVIRRWFAVSEVPFVAIFSEESGTFVMVDRTTTHPVGPGDCIVARGPVEIMSRTRPDIDLNGTLELCPSEWLAGG